jgi:hypothetical protein
MRGVHCMHPRHPVKLGLEEVQDKVSCRESEGVPQFHIHSPPKSEG